MLVFSVLYKKKMKKNSAILGVEKPPARLPSSKQKSMEKQQQQQFASSSPSTGANHHNSMLDVSGLLPSRVEHQPMVQKLRAGNTAQLKCRVEWHPE